MAKAKGNQAATVRDLTRDELAEELDVHPETIGRYDRDGAPHQRIGRANHYNAAEYRAWMRENNRTGREGRPPLAGDSPDMEAARLRKENALAAKYELQVKRETGELVPVDEVAHFIGEQFGALKNKLVGFGAAVTPQLEGRDAAERQELIDAGIGDILDDTSAAIRNLGRRA